MPRLTLIVTGLVAVTALGSGRTDEPETPTVMTNSIGMKLASIPAGEFEMGSPSKDQDVDAQENERPQHKVRISAFRMGATEVTVGQFRQFVQQTGYSMKADIGGGVRIWKSPGFEQTDQHPVVVVSWDDTVAFCNWLSRLEGLKEFYRMRSGQVTVPDWKANGYRLPTEAEWEYACRAGTKTRFSCPEGELGRYAWYRPNSGKGAHPVGEKLPNKFGLFDMHGNAQEWCWDWPDDYSSGSAAATLDPRGPQPASTRYRVSRGGSWESRILYVRSAYRSGNPHEARSNWVGFRVAQNQPGE